MAENRVNSMGDGGWGGTHLPVETIIQQSN